MKTLNIPLEDDEYKKARKKKQDRGFRTWKEVLLSEEGSKKDKN